MDLWSSSSSSQFNDSDIEDILFGEEAKNLLILHLVDKFETVKRKHPGSMVERLCISLNLALVHIMVLQFYFANVPTYVAHRFCRWYRMWRGFLCVVWTLPSKV